MYVAASESCALKAVGAKFIRDLEPGEILVFGPEGIVSRREHCEKKEKRLCIFEYIYFARPDSVLDGENTHGTAESLFDRRGSQTFSSNDVSDGLRACTESD